jgi:predicted ATPase
VLDHVRVAQQRSDLDRAVRSIRRDPRYSPSYNQWPASVPAVADVLRNGLELNPGLTVLVGENGSGKSTLVEMLAEAYGLNSLGGSTMSRFEGRATEPGIGHRLELERGAVRPHWSYYLRAETAQSLYTYLEDNPNDRRPEPRFHELSHGEGLLEILKLKTNGPGFYLLDEPDAALSFTASLALVAILVELVGLGSQLIVATHSPLVAATPGATILEVGDWGIRPATWEELDLVSSWRTFLDQPDAYLRRLIDE